VYAVDESGGLVVLPTTASMGPTTVPEWTATSADIFGGAKTVYAHPTLDCARRGPGAVSRPGTLYLVATDGTVASIIVDSTRLATDSPWPKWQRTAGNAGNTEATLFPLNPGCP